MSRHQRPFAFAVIALTLAGLLTVSAAPPTVRAGAHPPTPNPRPLFQASTSRNCPSGPSARPGSLPAGTHQGEFTLRGFANRPGARERVMVTIEGKLDLTVGNDGQWRDSTAETTFLIQGAGQPSKEVVTGSFTDATGTLRQQHDTAGRHFSVEGTLTGEVLIFARNIQSNKGPTQKGATTGQATIEFTTSQVLCATASGTASSPLMAETLRAFAAQGMETSGGTGRWFVAPGGTREGARLNESNVMAVQKAVAEGLAMTTEPAGPKRRMAESRFARIEEEITGACPAEPGHCLLCFKRCPGPQERECMKRIWFDGYVKAMSTWLEQELSIIRKTNVGAPKSALYASSAMNFEGLQPYLVEALTLDRALAERGVDLCTKEVQLNVLQEIGDALGRLVQRMIRERRPPVDILVVDRQAKLLGDVSPPAAKTAFDYVRQVAEQEAKIVLSYLVARGRKPIENNWDLCIPENRTLWDWAIDAESQVNKIGGNTRAALDYREKVKPRESKPGCGK